MAMLTDSPPRKTNLRFFQESARLKAIPLPEDGRFARIAAAIEAAMKTEDMKDVPQVCDDFIGTASDFYQVPQCSIRVLAARPLLVREH